jgi:hypothetical protein
MDPLKESVNALNTLLTNRLVCPSKLYRAIADINAAIRESPACLNWRKAQETLARRVLRLLMQVPAAQGRKARDSCVEGILFQIDWCAEHMVVLFRARIGTYDGAQEAEELAWEALFGAAGAPATGAAEVNTEMQLSIFDVLAQAPGSGRIIGRCFELADRAATSPMDKSAVLHTFKDALVDPDSIEHALPFFSANDLSGLLGLVATILDRCRELLPGGARHPYAPRPLPQHVEWSYCLLNPDPEVFAKCLLYAIGSADDPFYDIAWWVDGARPLGQLKALLLPPWGAPPKAVLHISAAAVVSALQAGGGALAPKGNISKRALEVLRQFLHNKRAAWAGRRAASWEEDSDDEDSWGLLWEREDPLGLKAFLQGSYKTRAQSTFAAECLLAPYWSAKLVRMFHGGGGWAPDTAGAWCDFLRQQTFQMLLNRLCTCAGPCAGRSICTHAVVGSHGHHVHGMLSSQAFRKMDALARREVKMVMAAAGLEITTQRHQVEHEEGREPSPADKEFRHRQLLCLARFLCDSEGNLDATLFERALLHVVNPRWSEGPNGLQRLKHLLDANFAAASFAMAFGHVGVGVALALIPRLVGEAAMRGELTARLRACRAAFRRLKSLAVRVKARAGARGGLLAEILYRPPLGGFRAGILYEESLRRFSGAQAAAPR